MNGRQGKSFKETMRIYTPSYSKYLSKSHRWTILDRIMKKLLLITDLGRIRSLQFKKAGDDPAEKDHLVEHINRPISAPVGQLITDTAGKFNRGFAAGEGKAMSNASLGKLEEEMEKRSLEQVADEIQSIVSEADYPRFTLVAPQKILKRLVNTLTPQVRNQMNGTIGADLIKENRVSLEKRFNVC